MNKIKAVIFDMDGVLIDARDWHYEALNKSLSYFGFTISRYDHLVTFDGLPTKRKLEMLSLERGLPYGLHSFINEIKQNFTLEMVYSKCKPVFYHEYALAKLKSQGFLLAVASNSIKQTIELMMEKSNLQQYLEFNLSNEDVTNPKPNPEIYQVAIKRLGLSPKECLIVEDNQNGIKAAIASGAHLMAVKSVEDVNFSNIFEHIIKAEEGSI